MKNTFKIGLLAALVAGSANAGISVIDTTTQVTNHTSSSQWITLLGTPYTNVLYVATNPAAIITGDSLPTAFTKVNSNFVYVAAQIATNADQIATLSVSNANWQTWQGYTNALVAGSLAWWLANGVTNAGSSYVLSGTFIGTIVVPTLTISSSASSTMGFGAGLVAADADYLYISADTNLWRRIAIPTNSW